MRPLRWFIGLWVKPVRAEPVAAFRVSIAAIVLLDTLFSLLPDATDWFGVHGTFSPGQFEDWSNQWSRWSVLPTEAPDWLIYLLLGVLALSAVLVVVGLATRVASVAMWVLLVSFQVRHPNILNAGDTLLRCAAFYIMLMPAGAAWSIDNLIRRRLGWRVDGWIQPWSLRFAQIQILVVYLYTGVEKLRGFKPAALSEGGYLGDWVSGWAVYKAMVHGTIGRFGEFFSQFPWWVFAPMTWATLAFEVLFVPLIWWRRTRWYVLAFGFMVHVGIFATMEVTHFSWTTLSYYWLFVPAAVLMDMAGKQTGSDIRRRYTVFYDGMCPICRKSKRTLERLDWLGRLTYADIHDRKFAEAELPGVTYADMLREMWVKRPDGKHFGGFKAFRAMAAVLPLCWPIVPFLWLPGAAFVGKRVYGFIARNRFRYAKCDDEFCSLHLKLLAGKKIDDEVIAKVVELHENRRKHLAAQGAGA
jgi:predicted DCC family thiol-disulfide oxidoreductase YuxK